MVSCTGCMFRRGAMAGVTGRQGDAVADVGIVREIESEDSEDEGLSTIAAEADFNARGELVTGFVEVSLRIAE